MIRHQLQAAEIQQRLPGDVTKALDILEARHRDGGCEARAGKVVPLRA